jgi:protein-tyrosine phosphatase
MAEGILQLKAKEAGLDWTVDSAGTGNYHIGEPPHKLSQKVAKLNGVDICDKIYAMDNNVYNDIKRISRELWDPSKTDLLMNEVYPGKDIDVPDPWFGGERDFHEVYHMISKACDAIIEKASPNLPIDRDGGALKKQL